MFVLIFYIICIYNFMKLNGTHGRSQEGRVRLTAEAASNPGGGGGLTGCISNAFSVLNILTHIFDHYTDVWLNVAYPTGCIWWFLGTPCTRCHLVVLSPTSTFLCSLVISYLSIREKLFVSKFHFKSSDPFDHVQNAQKIP